MEVGAHSNIEVRTPSTVLNMAVKKTRIKRSATGIILARSSSETVLKASVTTPGPVKWKFRPGLECFLTNFLIPDSAVTSASATGPQGGVAEKIETLPGTGSPTAATGGTDQPKWWADQKARLLFMGISFISFLFFGIFVDLNATSLQSFIAGNSMTLTWYKGRAIILSI